MQLRKSRKWVLILKPSLSPWFLKMSSFPFLFEFESQCSKSGVDVLHWSCYSWFALFSFEYIMWVHYLDLFDVYDESDRLSSRCSVWNGTLFNVNRFRLGRKGHSWWKRPKFKLALKWGGRQGWQGRERAGWGLREQVGPRALQERLSWCLVLARNWEIQALSVFAN